MKSMKLIPLFAVTAILSFGCEKETPLPPTVVVPHGVCTDQAAISKALALSDQQMWNKSDPSYTQFGYCSLNVLNGTYWLQSGPNRMSYYSSQQGAVNGLREAIQNCQCGM